MRRSYQRNDDQREGDETQDALESYVREGAQQMLATVLEEEVNAFLGRHRYVRGKAFRGYRNGYHPARELTVGLGPVAVRVPRVAQVPEEVASQGFHSEVVQRYQRASQTTQRLFARLYLEGLATGDFEPVFRELVGETTALSDNTVVRLKEHWGGEYEAWRQPPLGEHQYAYIWADGVYMAAGTEKEKTALLCVLGAREDGVKELLAMEAGYRDALARAGYAPIVTGDPQEALSQVEANDPHLVLLDLMLPGTDGIELMGNILDMADVTVIFLSAYGQEETIARAFEKGADDYVVKPFSPTELVARIKAALRKREAPEWAEPSEPFVLGELTIDYAPRRVTLAGRPVQLTAIEYGLLFELSVNAGRVMTYDRLLRRVWGLRGSGDSRRVRTAAKQLRRKLGDDANNPTYILNEPRVGYRMEKGEAGGQEEA